ncbi:MAG: histidine kinase [Lachnospiraceae bacterium]|nr:histidine kinase [Lachnospiraceae bacterium]
MKHQKSGCKSLLKTFNKSIFLAHLCVLALSLLLSFTVLLSVSRKQYIRQSQASMDLLVLQLESLSENLITIRNNLLVDNAFCEYLSTPRKQTVADTKLQNEINNQLSSLILSNHYIDSFAVYQGESTVLNISSDNRIISPQSRTSMVLQQMPVYQSVSKSRLTWGGIRKYTDLLPSYYDAYYAEGGSRKIIPLLLSLGNLSPDRQHSVLAANIPLSYLEMVFDQNVPAGCFASLYDGSGDLLYTNAKSNKHHRLDSVIESPLNYSNWQVKITIPFSVFFHNVSMLLVTAFCIFLGSSLLVSAISTYIGRKLLNPFQDIIAQMDEIRSENLEQRISAQQYTELNNLTDHFNNLMDRVQHLIKVTQNYAEEKRVLEVQALQSQINPHFVYNSLTTIRWMASMARSENVCQALLSLSNTLRPIFSDSSTFWSLNAEQNFLENYCSIMGYRIGYKTRLIFEIPDSFAEIMVPRFILQPIVENSLIHGLSTVYDDSSREIRITAAQNGPFLELHITDNGIGVPEEKRLRMNSDFEKSIPLHTTTNLGKHSIGLYNVNRRLQLQYGEGSGLRFLETQSGTCVRMRLLLPDKNNV